MLVSSTCITVTIITENVMAHLRAEPRGAVGASATIVGRGALHLEDVVHVGVKVSGQAADRMEPVEIDAAGGSVVEAVADVEVDDLADHEVGRRVAHRNNPDQPALHADGRGRHARGLHLRARRRRQPGDPELVHLAWIIPDVRFICSASASSTTLTTNSRVASTLRSVSFLVRAAPRSPRRDDENAIVGGSSVIAMK